MLSDTANLKKKLSKHHNILDIIDYYDGKDCYIITCGPSLNDYNLKLIKARLKDKLVICVKQAYPLFKDICDIHISNFTNYTENNCDYKKTINIVGYLPHRTSDVKFLKTLEAKNNVDLKFKVGLHPKYKYISVLCKKNPKELYNMLKGFVYKKKAIVGAGIIYEICFPLAIAMGVRSITTIGWDIGPSSSSRQYEHFYDKASRYYKLKGSNQRRQVNHLKLRHEAKVIAEASGVYSDFLIENGIELRILSKRNIANSSIKRIKLKDL